MVGMFILPYWYVGRKPNSFGGTRYQIGLSLANCLSGGVFIATFFVGLMPEVRSMFKEVFDTYKIDTDFPITECAMFLGFIIALGIEQSVLEYREKKKGIYSSLPQGFPEETPKPDHPNPASFPLKDVCDSNNLDYDSDNATRTTVLPANNSRMDNESILGSPIHSHSHNHHHHGHSHDIGDLLTGDSEIRLGMLMVSLGVHSIFEGLALGLQTSIPTLINLVVGVAVHELLVAFAMGVNVSRLRLKPPTVLKLALIFSASIPAGQLLGLLIGHYQSTAALAVSATLQGLAAGTFIHVTFLEVIPAEFIEAGPRLLKVFFVALGFTLLLFCQVILMNDGAGQKHH
ncbi:hypothetical protein JTE90_021555 [Oedothorax gibbosus]|uniref:Zinc transporter ZIP3 n=1 Tax=Oedothorax gibbosus TaxID=931172 RepID=A0AAV6VRC6_9ARAC|nr:hypothetical protein JTE90_021555 [Oedothorax gibbosus]